MCYVAFCPVIRLQIERDNLATGTTIGKLCTLLIPFFGLTYQKLLFVLCINAGSFCIGMA
jgi:hypothetical protein